MREATLGSHGDGDNASYNAIHFRLTRHRGPAATFDCVDCGGPAFDWSFIHETPQEFVRDGKWGPYSIRLDDYEPRCRSCHKRYDA